MKRKRGKAKRNRKIKELYVPRNHEKRIGAGNKILMIILIISMIVLTVSIVVTFLQPQELTIFPGQTIEYYYPKFFSVKDSTYVSMYLPAVDENGQGIITTLGVESVPGSGRVLVDIENLVFWDDTQESIRTAKKVVRDITTKNLTNYDFVYNIHTDANMVGGPSAGAAIAIATIAALENKTLKENVMITGAIKEDGTLNLVTAVRAKAEAAKQINITTFLVPPGQSKETYYEIKKDCSSAIEKFCIIRQISKERDIASEVGINIVEVSTIQEALNYFF
jgi:uncharacterized protein